MLPEPQQHDIHAKALGKDISQQVAQFRFLIAFRVGQFPAELCHDDGCTSRLPDR